MDRFITEARLAALIKFAPYSLAKWRKAGAMPTPHLINKQYHYRYADADAWILGICRNVSEGMAPTVDRLRQRQVILLTTKEVMRRFAANGGDTLSRSTLFHQAEALKWPLAVFSATDFRFFAATIDEAAATLAVPTYTVGRLEHFLGVKKGEVFQLISDDRLETLDVFGSKETHVTEESLCVLLADCLPGGMSPRDWLDDRCRSKRPLVSGNRASLMLKIHQDRITKRIIDGDLVHIRLPSGQYRIPAEAVSALRVVLPPRKLRTTK
jgi:hypothetical protein